MTDLATAFLVLYIYLGVGVFGFASGLIVLGVCAVAGERRGQVLAARWLLGVLVWPAALIGVLLYLAFWSRTDDRR